MSTTEQSVAYARASGLLEIVSSVKRAKNAYRHSELDAQEYLGEVGKMVCRARRTEILQLRKEDIKVDEKTKRHYILITDKAGSVKTENAIRQVPIHQKLIDEGFLDFVKECDGPKIFSTLTPETLTKWFSPFRESLGIPRHNDFGSPAHHLKAGILHKIKGGVSVTDVAKESGFSRYTIYRFMNEAGVS